MLWQVNLPDAHNFYILLLLLIKIVRIYALASKLTRRSQFLYFASITNKNCSLTLLTLNKMLHRVKAITLT